MADGRDFGSEWMYRSPISLFSKLAGQIALWQIEFTPNRRENLLQIPGRSIYAHSSVQSVHKLSPRAIVNNAIPPPNRKKTCVLQDQRRMTVAPNGPRGDA